MPKILIAECMQEISTFNPVPSRSDDFDFLRGDEILSYHQGVETDVAGALSVFGARDDVELVPTWSARQKTSGGVLDAESFTRMSDECASIIRDRASGIDACYFCLHGAMSAENELDPEGFLLEKTREILGPSVPIVISLDLHGILTDRMLKNSNGLTMLHTYPHVDFADNGARAARLLLQILDRGVKPTVARVPIPALVRGDELITETGIYGKFIHRVQDIERKAGVLAAGMMIGNPFTDVPDLCSQPVVVTDNDPALAEREAVTLAEEFWEKRATMQPDLVTIDEAVAGAKELLGKGTVIFTDAADATSSGASGDSNAAIVGLLEIGYEGTILTAIV
ncbi:MAG: M81 family metallopeptidase, partial [Planctomycetes bacterium]|nr:M81 family metallopeptidase [Planctomycetota bacterium]